MRSEFLLTNLNELATTGTSSLDNKEHFSANLVLELPILSPSSLSGKIKVNTKGLETVRVFEKGFCSFWKLSGHWSQFYRMLASFDSETRTRTAYACQDKTHKNINKRVAVNGTAKKIEQSIDIIN